jgi:hypothetical protein
MPARPAASASDAARSACLRVASKRSKNWFSDQGLAGHHAHHAGVLFCEREQHLQELAALALAVGLVLGDAVGKREHRAFDEFDEPLVHLRLGGEVPIERSFGDVQLRRERGRGDALPLGRLEHLRERFEDLQPAFAFGPWHVSDS